MSVVLIYCRTFLTIGCKKEGKLRCQIMQINEAIKKVIASQSLNDAEMLSVMRDVMSGRTTDAQNAGFLVGMQIKGPDVVEITAAARVMRELAVPVSVQDRSNLLDTCGTGGSGSNTFNISTASALVAAVAGARVAKHGNRSASSKSGSADVLEAAGVSLDLSAAQVAACVDSIGVGFMFAPAHHSAMKHVAPARKELGVRTIFNLLGPLTNPARAVNQVMGVYDSELIEPLVEVLRGLGARNILVVAAEDGLDEISCSAATHVGELREGEIFQYIVTPEEFGIKQRKDYFELQVSSPEESLKLLKSALTYSHEGAGDIVALNAGAAIYVANLSSDLAAGVEQAKKILASGLAMEKLTELVNFTQTAAIKNLQ